MSFLDITLRNGLIPYIISRRQNYQLFWTILAYEQAELNEWFRYFLTMKILSGFMWFIGTCELSSDGLISHMVLIIQHLFLTSLSRKLTVNEKLRFFIFGIWSRRNGLTIKNDTSAK